MQDYKDLIEETKEEYPDLDLGVTADWTFYIDTLDGDPDLSIVQRSPVDPPGTWDHPTWRSLDFAWTVPHSFSFAFESHSSEGLAVFRARAHGDLDGDGLHSTFEISGESRDGAQPVVFPMQMHREIE